MEPVKLPDKVKAMKKAGAHFSCLSAFSKGKMFGLVYHFVKRGKSIDVKFEFSQTETVPNIADIYPSAAFYEREAHEMFGIKFEGLKEEVLFLPEKLKGKFPFRK